MMSKICQYCGSEKEADRARCAGCDAASFGARQAQQIHKGEPFHCNGYVVWWIEDTTRQTVEYLFYLGDRLVERIVLHRDVLRRFVSEHCDAMPFVWGLFEVAQGEVEVLRVTEQNTVKPKTFEITLKHSPAEEWAIGLTHYDVMAAIAIGKREITCHA